MNVKSNGKTVYPSCNYCNRGKCILNNAECSYSNRKCVMSRREYLTHLAFHQRQNATIQNQRKIKSRSKPTLVNEAKSQSKPNRTRNYFKKPFVYIAILIFLSATTKSVQISLPNVDMKWE